MIRTTYQEKSQSLLTEDQRMLLNKSRSSQLLDVYDWNWELREVYDFEYKLHIWDHTDTKQKLKS